MIDLEEIREIAELGDMKLYLTDYHLQSFRLYRAMNQPKGAESHRTQARKLIEETGYRRREKELED